ncbi:ABC transporter transmembrane domain-containing protein [Nocardioides convexus]|uniref:ABC transporter transmembrane domain-containing protein n=1 Tax=Nocardioides convexus TaxID=2712224 RepID=UPI0024181D49|nr:ABC transporter transmembrane domain-containing protein [Nocardioides convexus]
MPSTRPPPAGSSPSPGRDAGSLIGFVVLSVVTSALAVATPVLAGRVVNAIVEGGKEQVVTTLALAIAGLAVADAAFGLLARWLSARIGEGLILDLRTSVFDHVQRMPVAFFNRTRTGALVSRLNNDVIGAQRAFSTTLSGVVGNFVTLTLTLVVMLGISWQVTLLALVLLPVFVVPARRMGRRLAGIQREAADHNAAMGNQMTERFSAPGATLVKSVRPPGPGVGGVRRASAAGRPDRGPHGDGADHLRHRADPGLRTRRRGRLRRGRARRHPRQPRRR